MFSVNSAGHPAERDGSAFGGTSPGVIRGERPRLHRRFIIRVISWPFVVEPRKASRDGLRPYVSRNSPRYTTAATSAVPHSCDFAAIRD